MLISSALHCDHPVVNTLLQGTPTPCQGVQDKRNTTGYRTVEEACTTMRNLDRRRLFDVCLLSSVF
jgi:hypothetical protein